MLMLMLILSFSYTWRDTRTHTNDPTVAAVEVALLHAINFQKYSCAQTLVSTKRTGKESS